MKTTKKTKTNSTPSTAKNDAVKAISIRADEPKTSSAKPAPAHSSRTVSKPSLPPPAAATTQTAKPAEVKANHVLLELVKPGAKSVCVAGSFNQWTPETTPLVRKGNDCWVGDLTVKPGRHEYLFVVDGQWVPDPNAKESVANPFGGMNSVLIVSE